MKNLFKGKQYDYKIIIEVIGLYYHFGLSYRDCAKIMRKFSIPVNHTTIYGRSVTDVEFYQNHGGLTKPTLRLRENNVTSIVPLTLMGIHWICG